MAGGPWVGAIEREETAKIISREARRANRYSRRMNAIDEGGQVVDHRPLLTGNGLNLVIEGADPVADIHAAAGPQNQAGGHRLNVAPDELVPDDREPVARNKISRRQPVKIADQEIGRAHV